MTGLNGERAFIVSRERLKLRRIKSLALLKSDLSVADSKIISGENKHKKRKRKDGFSTSTEKTSMFRVPSAPVPSSHLLSENDVIVSGKSDCLTEEDTERVCSRRDMCWSHGSISVIGRRREMEDVVAVELGFLRRGSKVYDFFGVYDGHGGARVADACGELLHKLVAKYVAKEGGIDYDEKKEIDWEKVMGLSFRKMDEEVNKDGSDVAMTGSTAVVAVVGEDEVVVANCGDSRVILSRDGAAVALSDDHKPNRPDELERIQLLGGKVINWNGQRVSGVLATSRSIGDFYLKPFVISEPEVRVIKRSYKDEFLILACDGLWDVISNDVVCQIVRRFLKGQMTRSNSEQIANRDNPSDVVNVVGESSKNTESRATQAAALLAELAIAQGSKDNISVIVIEF